jgi:hypothetical protein
MLESLGILNSFLTFFSPDSSWLVFRDPSERYLGGLVWPLVDWFAVGWCGIVVR